MNMPRFTAEVSLYKTNTQYNTAGIKFSTAEVSISPQTWVWPWLWPKDRCIPGWVCVSPINCPCCEGPLPLGIAPWNSL